MSVPAINNLLIIDDSADYRQLLITFFKKACPDAHVEEYDPARGRPPETFPWGHYDLLILDYDLGNGENGLEWLRQYKTSLDFPPTIMLTAQDNEELVVNAMRFGAQSFLRKVGLTKGLLVDSINIALEKYKQDKSQANTQKIQVHLYNKEMFFESLKQVKKNDVIFLIEVDKYQALSDSLGIFGADKFASFVSEIISSHIKTSGLNGRMTRISDSTSGLLLENLDAARAETFAQTLCDKFSTTPYTHDNKPLGFSINVGVLCINEDRMDIGLLLSKVESACRRARDIEGNAYVMEGVQSAVNTLADYEMALSKEINNAIKEDRIKMLFQSLVLVSGQANKDFREIYQIRVNIFDADRNILEPKKFLPVLEKTNSLKKLDRWIIRYCAGELAKLKSERDIRLGLLIPMSVQSINDKELTDWVNRVVEFVKIPDIGRSLIFEIKVNDYINNSRQAKLQFNKLRVKLGAAIALIGVTDRATLEKCLQQDKFDFVIFSPEHAGAEKMPMDQIQKIVDLVHEHKSQTVASKIDSGEYLALSASAGVDYVLGHFVQPPMENIVSTEIVEVR